MNLRDADHARERYEEVINLVLYGASYRKLIPADCYLEDTINLDGKDWTFAQHRIIDTRPTLDDFQKVIKEYLAWKVSTVLKEEGCLGKTEARV